MSGADVAALIASVALVVLVCGLLIVLHNLNDTLRTARITIEQVRMRTIPLLEDLQTTVDQANGDLARMETVLGSAESISSTVDSASHLAYLLFSNPVIKAVAFSSGLGRMAHRLRRKKRS